jgi:hypothetical protein
MSLRGGEGGFHATPLGGSNATAACAGARANRSTQYASGPWVTGFAGQTIKIDPTDFMSSRIPRKAGGLDGTYKISSS